MIFANASALFSVIPKCDSESIIADRTVLRSGRILSFFRAVRPLFWRNVLSQNKLLADLNVIKNYTTVDNVKINVLSIYPYVCDPIGIGYGYRIQR